MLKRERELERETVWICKYVYASSGCLVATSTHTLESEDFLFVHLSLRRYACADTEGPGLLLYLLTAL